MPLLLLSPSGTVWGSDKTRQIQRLRDRIPIDSPTFWVTNPSQSAIRSNDSFPPVQSSSSSNATRKELWRKQTYFFIFIFFLKVEGTASRDFTPVEEQALHQNIQRPVIEGLQGGSSSSEPLAGCSHGDFIACKRCLYHIFLYVSQLCYHMHHVYFGFFFLFVFSQLQGMSSHFCKCLKPMGTHLIK